MLNQYINLIKSLAIMLIVSVVIASSFLFVIGYLYGQNRILGMNTTTRDQYIKAGTVIMEHMSDMERNGCFNKRGEK